MNFVANLSEGVAILRCVPMVDTAKYLGSEATVTVENHCFSYCFLNKDLCTSQHWMG